MCKCPEARAVQKQKRLGSKVSPSLPIAVTACAFRGVLQMPGGGLLYVVCSSNQSALMMLIWVDKPVTSQTKHPCDRSKLPGWTSGWQNREKRFPPNPNVSCECSSVLCINEDKTSTPAFPQFTVSHENWLTMWLVICCMLCFGLPCRGGGWVIDQLGIQVFTK